jgi:hypothetical protein
MWRHTTQRNAREHATQQVKLTRAHVFVHQLRRIRVRHQRHQSFRPIEWLDKRRFEIVAPLAEQIKRRQLPRRVFEPLAFQNGTAR